MDGQIVSRHIAPNGLKGWAAMAKTIRDKDEDKIKDYKEDIDTLLVFTGLFSAVLSSFLVESYQLLQPDKQDTVIHLLGQIYGQTNSYVITPTRINSTVPPSSPSLPPFVPPPSILCVNQLWFASLILALITASFSMLVKQWLREYLAMDYTSPQERLRARQFRYPGLGEWKVFEIAGVLPLLLQLSLSLFLLGLCFFTWSVNPGLGHASTVLTSGWAFLFTSVILAPIFSPRCPYKTTLLKSAMVIIRRRIVPPVYHGGLRPLWKKGILPSWNAFVFASRQLTPHVKPWWQRGSSFISTICPLLCLPPPAHGSQREEMDAVSHSADELTMLKEVDMDLLDDDLLGTSIFESLLQQHAAPDQILSFIVHAITLRLGGPPESNSGILDLRGLMLLSWTAVIDMVANTILHGLRRDAADDLGWLPDALRLLFARSNHLLTPTARRALAHSVQPRTIPIFLEALASLAAGPHDLFVKRLHDMLIPISDQLLALHDAQELSPQEVVHFVRSILALEVPGQVKPSARTRDAPIASMGEIDNASPGPPLMDLRDVSRRTWNVSLETLSKILLNAAKVVDNVATVGVWLENAIQVLFSRSEYPMPLLADKAMAALIENDNLEWRILDYFFRQVRTVDTQPSYVLSRFRNIRKQFTSPDKVQELLESIAWLAMCSCNIAPNGESPTMIHLVKHFGEPRYREDPEDRAWAAQYLHILDDLLLECDPEAIVDAWPAGYEVALRGWLFIPNLLERMSPDGSKAFMDLLCSRMSPLKFLSPLLTSDPIPECVDISDRVPQGIENVASSVENADTKERGRFIRAMTRMCKNYLSPQTRNDENQDYMTLNPVRLLFLLLKVHSRIQDDTSHSDHWRKLYEHCADCIELHAAEKNKRSYPTVAIECLQLLDEFEPAGGNSAAHFEAWAQRFDESASLFPDKLFRMLAVIHNPGREPQSKRLRLLERAYAPSIASGPTHNPERDSDSDDDEDDDFLSPIPRSPVGIPPHRVIETPQDTRERPPAAYRLHGPDDTALVDRSTGPVATSSGGHLSFSKALNSTKRFFSQL